MYIYTNICIYIFMSIGLGSTCRVIQQILLAGSVVSAIVYIYNFVIYTTIYMYIQICIYCIYTLIYIQMYIYIYVYWFRLNLQIYPVDLLAGSVVSAIVYIDSFVIYTTIYMYLDICIFMFKHIQIYIQMYVYIYVYRFRLNLQIYPISDS